MLLRRKYHAMKINDTMSTENFSNNQESLQDFITQAALFCVYLEDAEQPKKSEFIEKMLYFLPLLYTRIKQLSCPNLTMDGVPERFATEEEYNIIRNKVETILGTDDAYLEVFMEDFRYSDEPITAFISENIADIHQELDDLVSNWQIENDCVRNDALVACMEAFKEHWGQKLLNVLRPLHALSLEIDE